MQEEIIPKNLRTNREIDPETIQKPLDVATIFGNNHPLELEIGMGKGLFLAKAALENPEHNFVGIELRRKYLNRARERVEKRDLPNARVVCDEAFSFMETCLKPESLQTVHVYFPDPWPKKRHHKRRLFSEEFVTLVHALLEPGGHLLIATDHKDYWDWISRVMLRQTLLEPTDRLPETPANAQGLTNYEIKYQREGRPIYKMGLRKPPPANGP